MKEALSEIVGKSNVLTSPEESKPYFTDWRRQYSAAAECVVRPASTAQVARVVALCARQGVAIVPQGGNTGLSGGSVPTGDRREIVLALGRMNRILEMDPFNDTATVEAGCILSTVQQAAGEAGRLFPLSLAAEGSCQIGGNLSTNAGGVNVLRYGMAREQVLGLEVVLPDGRVWNGLRGLRKDNTGYDLKQLFVGAEGTLGIITAAVLRLYPKPTASAIAWIEVANPRRAVELLGHLRSKCGNRISAFELLSRSCVDAVLAHRPSVKDPLPGSGAWYVLTQLDDSGSHAELEERLATAIGEGYNAVIAKSASEARALWGIRETVPEAQFVNVKHDVSVPISKTPELIERAERKLKAAWPEVRMFAFGHVGDGNIHLNVGPETLVAQREAVNRVVYDVVAGLGGSISAEHGLGQLKRTEILRHKDPVEMELMRSLKHALDPLGLMNPGKLL